MPMFDMMTALRWAFVKRIELAVRMHKNLARSYTESSILTVKVISPFGICFLARHVEY